MALWQSVCLLHEYLKTIIAAKNSSTPNEGFTGARNSSDRLRYISSPLRKHMHVSKSTDLGRFFPVWS
jgi:hypothetical protein